MGWLGDILKFEGFNAKDMIKKVAKHPDQLLTGVDPLSTELWNKALGRNYEPIVDQMGGAYGGKPLSAFGYGQDGGVYGRAKEAGIDTKAGGYAQDAAHVVAALYAGGYGLGKLGGTGGGSGASGNNYQQYARMANNQNGSQGGQSRDEQLELLRRQQEEQRLTEEERKRKEMARRLLSSNN